MKPISMKQIVESYQGILFDAYGVLVDGSGTIPGATKLIEVLENSSKPYFIVSNGSTATTTETAKSYARKGLSIVPEKIISSGSLLKKWVQKNHLQHQPVKVLGPQKSLELVTWAGATPVPMQEKHYQALILCNQDGYDFLPTLDQILTELYDMALENKLPKLVLPNPDIIYPKAPGQLGFTIGSVASLIETALKPLFPKKKIEFEKLGKPYAPIFEEAVEKSGISTQNLVMIGDQIITDIKGANDFGIESILVSFGLTDIQEINKEDPILPRYILNSLKL